MAILPHESVPKYEAEDPRDPCDYGEEISPNFQPTQGVSKCEGKACHEDSLMETKDYCHAKTPVSLSTLPAKLPPLYLSFTPTYLLRKSSVNPYILKLFK